LAATAPCLAALVAAGAMLAPRIDFLWLPADRLMDGFLLALILGGAQVLWLTGPRRPRASARARGVGALALVLAVGMWPRGAEPTLTIIPRPRDWPTYKEVGRGLRLDDLWRALTRLPPGRILFLRSAVPLEFGPHWWRPHTHVTALTPLLSGREIIGGTFTHPSPVAGLLYTGSAHHRAITRLAEQRDGVTLFGRPLDDLSAGEFEQLAERLRISVVVALDEDVGHLPFLGETSTFEPAGSVGPFRIFATPSGRALPEVTGPEERRLPPPSRAGWVETGLAYSPLWRARLDGAHLSTRANDLGLLMIEMPPRASGPVILDHAPGWAEWTGVGLTLGTLALLAATARRRRAGAAPSPWPRSAP